MNDLFEIVENSKEVSENNLINSEDSRKYEESKK